jgi:hypothetical protein
MDIAGQEPKCGRAQISSKYLVQLHLQSAFVAPDIAIRTKRRQMFGALARALALAKGRQSTILVGRMLNRAKAVLGVDRLRLLTFLEGPPFRRHICVRSISHDRTGIDCRGVLICGDDDSLNWITDALLEPHFGGPSDTCLRLPIHDPRRFRQIAHGHLNQ